MQARRQVSVIGALACLVACQPAAAPARETYVVADASAPRGVQTIAPASVPAPPRAAPEEELVWLTDEAAATAQARAKKKPMVFVFCALWATECGELSKITLADPRTRAALARFVAVTVDVTDHDVPNPSHISDRMGVTTVPTIVVLDSAGVEAVRITQLVNAEQLVGQLGNVR